LTSAREAGQRDRMTAAEYGRRVDELKLFSMVTCDDFKIELAVFRTSIRSYKYHLTAFN